MFKVKGMDHININVRDLKETKAFYKEFFGFEVIDEYKYLDESKNEISFSLIGIPGIMMLCLYEGRYVNTGYENMGHIGINVTNFKEAYDHAFNKGLVIKKWGLIEYDKSKSFYITDPNELQLEISEAFAGGH